MSSSTINLSHITPPQSPNNNSKSTNRNSVNSSPRKLKALPRSIEAWRSLEIKLGEVINQLNYDPSNSAATTSTVLISNSTSNLSPSKSSKSTTSNVTKITLESDSSSSFLKPSSSSNSSLQLTSDELVGGKSKPSKSLKPSSKFKSILRLRSTSTSSSSSPVSSNHHGKDSNSTPSKRSNSSTRSIAVNRDPLPTTLTTSSSSPVVPSFSSALLSQPPPTTSSDLSPLIHPSIPKLRKVQSLIQLSSSWFRKVDNTIPPPPPVPTLASQFIIPISPPLSSPSFSLSSTASPSTTLVSSSAETTPLSPFTSTFKPKSFSSPSSTLISSSPQSNSPASSTHHGALEMLLSFSNRFRPNLSMSHSDTVTDEELSSWRKDVGMEATPLGERISLDTRNYTFGSKSRSKFGFGGGAGKQEQEEEEEGEETLLGLGLNHSLISVNRSSSIRSISSSVSSTHNHHQHLEEFLPPRSKTSQGMSRNVSQSPSLPPFRPRAPILIRSVSTSSLPSSSPHVRRNQSGGLVPPPMNPGEFGSMGGSGGGQTRSLTRKLSFTPISIPASPANKSPRRRLELAEAFPLPPIRM